MSLRVLDAFNGGEDFNLGTVRTIVALTWFADFRDTVG
jgi:hypothetical protein